MLQASVSLVSTKSPATLPCKNLLTPHLSQYVLMRVSQIWVVWTSKGARGGMIEMDYHQVHTNPLWHTPWQLLGGLGFLKTIQIRIRWPDYSKLCPALARLTAFSTRRFIFSPQHNLARFAKFPCLRLFFQWAWQKRFILIYQRKKLHMIILCFPLYNPFYVNKC